MGSFRNPFSNKTVSFLRSLKRNNDREWFRARREQYDAHVREPMVKVVEQLAQDFRTVAPELIASPKQSLFRVYRDTRFSDNKKPLKTHAAAIFRTRDLPKPQGAGLYFEIAPGWVWIGGGMWRPEPPELVRIREHIADTWPEMRGIARSAAFRRRFAELSGDTMTRVPRGYRADHPAADYLKFRQFYGGAEFPASLAHSREFYPTLLATFKALMPLVRFLNEPLVGDSSPSLPGGRSETLLMAVPARAGNRLRGEPRTGADRFYEWSTVSALATGTEVGLVLENGEAPSGRLDEVTSESLSLWERSGRRVVSRANIQRVTVRTVVGASRVPHVIQSALIGAAIGGALAFASAAAEENSGPGGWKGLLLFGDGSAPPSAVSGRQWSASATR